MSIRHFTLAPLAAVFVGCVADTPATTEATVRLAVSTTHGHASAVVPGAEHGGRPLATSLTQEVTTTPVWQGDPDGRGDALITVNFGQGEICWQLSVSDIVLPATASHIHRAAPGIRGPIVVPLSAPNAEGVAVGCAHDVARELLEEVMQSPESFYVNVHTTDFPAGAVRGQLPQ